MRPPQAIESFTEKHPFIGPLFWIASFQYYIVQIIVASAWLISYSWRNNTISDLGATVCGIYSNRYVCSPSHQLMNISFIVLGITMILGALLIYPGFKQSKANFIGFSFMAISGVGTIMVGLFPENVNPSLHAIGAFLPFVIGNISLLILGYSLDLPKSLRYFTIIAGVISLIAFILFTRGNYLGLGIGGMERVAVYPQTAWLIIFGIYVSNSHMKERGSSL